MGFVRGGTFIQRETFTNAAFREVANPDHEGQQADQQQGKGAGLGLTLVSDIVEFHQGKLTFDTSELGGLLVKVSLPN